MRKIWVKIKLFGVGFIVHGIINFIFSAGLAPYLVWQFGFRYAFVSFFIINLIKNRLMVYAYDHLRTDWFRIESTKQTKHATMHQLEITVIRKKKTVIKKVKNLLVVWILIVWDPTFAVLYAREGYHQYDGIKKKVLGVFLLSILINTLALTGGLNWIITVIKNHLN